MPKKKKTIFFEGEAKNFLNDSYSFTCESKKIVHCIT